MLRGRHGECETLRAVLETVRAGESAALVLRGEPGVGKTALLEYLRRSAVDCRVVHAAGAQSEMEFAFAGLHQLCAPVLDRVGVLPATQRGALETAFGLSAGEPPDRFMVGMAVLGLLAEASTERPVVCLVDDAQWLDRVSAQALAFVARRLLAESVALVFATRPTSDELAGLPELMLEGLASGDARALLQSVLPGPLDERVRDRIVAETRGNPLALIELPRGLSPAQLAGGFGAPDAPALSQRIEETFLQRLAPLGEHTRRLLLVAAADPLGDPALVWRAAAALGVGQDAAEPAVAADLLEIGARVQFRHPLVRSAIYRAAPLSERQGVHQALAEATDPELDPDRRAWHRSQAARGPDGAVALELERSAGRAQARAGLAAGAAFLERATRLTLDPASRGRRALAAAAAHIQAGAFETALELLAVAVAGPLDERGKAQAETLRGQVAFASNRGDDDATRLLLDGARRLEPLDPALARATYLAALSAALFAGRLGRDVSLEDVARAVRTGSPPPGRPGASEILLDGLALLYTDGYAAATEVLQRAVEAFGSGDVRSDEGLHLFYLAGITAALLWDEAGWDRVSARHLALSRESGALSEVPMGLNSRIYVHLWTGELDQAAALLEELEAVTAAIGGRVGPYGALGLAAWRGDDAQVDAMVDAAMRDVVARGEGIGVTVAQWASALRSNGHGRYDEALAAARLAAGFLQERAASSHWALVELIEAAARSGEREQALQALGQLTTVTRAAGSDWALGVEARSRAVASDDASAEALYLEAIERLGRTRARLDLARAHLLYGEWLRRRRRRVNARSQLQIASELFVGAGAAAFAERARRERLATGEVARRRTVTSRDDLTPQEGQIARRARDGLTNAEISAQLLLSLRTVEWHLRNVFTKLGIGSRQELRDALPAVIGAAAAERD